MTNKEMAASHIGGYAEIVELDCKEKCKHYSEPQSINPACNYCTRYNPVKMDMFEEHKYCVTCDHLISEIENDGTCKDCVEKNKYLHTEEQK